MNSQSNWNQQQSQEFSQGEEVKEEKRSFLEKTEDVLLSNQKPINITLLIALLISYSFWTPGVYITMMTFLYWHFALNTRGTKWIFELVLLIFTLNTYGIILFAATKLLKVKTSLATHFSFLFTNGIIAMSLYDPVWKYKLGLGSTDSLYEMAKAYDVLEFIICASIVVILFGKSLANGGFKKGLTEVEVENQPTVETKKKEAAPDPSKGLYKNENEKGHLSRIRRFTNS